VLADSLTGWTINVSASVMVTIALFYVNIFNILGELTPPKTTKTKA